MKTKKFATDDRQSAAQIMINMQFVENVDFSLAECYYTFNYKNHWDPGLFHMLHIT